VLFVGGQEKILLDKIYGVFVLLTFIFTCDKITTKDDSSSSNRAKQTAEIIAKGLNLEVEVLKELDERMQVSVDDEEALIIENNYFNYDYKNDRIQTCRDFIEKNFVGFYKIMENHKEKNESVIVVAHSSTLYALATFVNGVPENRNIVWMQCSNCAVVKFFVEN
jgi:broad specificity phosphatase PhoE